MDTTETTTPAQDTAARLRAVADFLDTEAIDLQAPHVTVNWHLHDDTDWRGTVRTITGALNAQWVAHHYGSSYWLETADTRIGKVTIFVPEDAPRRPVLNPDLSEFTAAGRRAAAETPAP